MTSLHDKLEHHKPSRGLDVELWAQFGYTDGEIDLAWREHKPIAPTEIVNGRTMAEALELFPDDIKGIASSWNVPALTGSVDAITVLVQKHLSNVGITCGTHQSMPFVYSPWARLFYKNSMQFEAHAATPAMAIAAAFVRAWEVK